MTTKFALIGSGRVASHLSEGLVRGGLECIGIWSRTLSHAETLAEKVGSKALGSLDDLIAVSRAKSISFLLISVSDDAISGVVENLPRDLPIPVFHTSGSTGIEALEPLTHRGVLYPLQTFSPEQEVDLSAVPFFVEYTTLRAKEAVEVMTSALQAKDVRLTTSEERLRLHIAAVFGCNFVNHLYALAAKVLRETSIPFSALEPLLKETLEKALTHTPKSVQTGPAVRGDEMTLTKHVDFLRKEDDDLAFLYTLLSKNIQFLSEEE